MSGFLEMVDSAQALLESRGRVSFRALRREFELDDETLDDLVEELVEEQQIASRDGSGLVWRGESASASPASQPETTPADDARAPAPFVPDASSPEPDTGERRQLTVMFCDLVGSTELAQRIDPEELRQVLREYRSVCVEATKRFDGHIAQYLGDGVMVYFGYPLAHEDDAGRAVRAALEIQRVLAERSDASRTEARIEARIGIHTGLVVVDPGGSGEDTLALGPTSNVASRIEGAAKPGTVVVSQDTLSLCRGAFVTRSLGETPLKGVEAPMQLHEVHRGVGVRSAIGTSSLKPMVGRDREVDHLLDRWEEAQDGRGQVVLVSGEPGMGKSRLLQALREELGDAQHLWLDMQCSPFTSGSAFQPLVDLFHAGLGFSAAESPQEASRQLVTGLDAMPGMPGDKVIPYLVALLGLPASERYPLPQTAAEEQRSRTLAALVQLNLTLSEQQPVVFVAEDLHWSDPSTLEYLSREVEQAPTKRMMLVLTFRPEFDAPWKQSHVSELKLARLSRRVTREMIANAVGGDLPEPVLAELETRSDGVPLFVEELASGVVGSGVLTEQAGRYELRGTVKDLSIPATLQDSLMARLDRLSASKHVAQQAATLGREFSYELIEAVTDLDPPPLRNALAQLATAEIVHQRGTPPDASYTFKHALLRDTAYESQLLSTRKALHGKIAAVLEERFPDRVASEPEVMARHCAAAGEAEKAIGHYERAAELAVARLSNQEASEHLIRALEALESLPEDDERNQREITIRIALGQSLMILHGYEAREVLDAFARVEELCDAIGEGPQQVPALIGLAMFDMARGSMRDGRKRAEALLRIAEPLGVQELLVLGHALIGMAAMMYSSPIEGEERLSRAVEIIQRVDFPPPATAYINDLVSVVHAAHAIALAICAKPDQAMKSMRAMRKRFSEIDHDYSTAGALTAVSMAWYVAYDPETTRSTADEALAIVEGRGFYSAEIACRIMRGWARACLGQPDEGVSDVEYGLALAETTGSDVVVPIYLVVSAHVHRMAKNRERAEELLSLAKTLDEPDGSTPQIVEITFADALIRLEFGDGLPEVENLLLLAVGHADHFEEHARGLRIRTHLARIAPQTGKVREAHDRLAGYYAQLTEGFDRAPAREAKAALDELAALLETET